MKYNYTEEDLLELHFFDTNEDSFSLGYIIKEFDDSILIESISEYGTLLGYQIRMKNIIKKIIWKSDYIDIFNFHISYNKKLNAFDNYKLGEELWEFNGFQDGLMDCYNMGLNISIISEDLEYVAMGKIISIDDENIILLDKDINNLEEHFENTIAIESITGIEILSIENHLLTEYEKTL